MLAAVRQGFEAAGYEVLGTATSGQAAQALGEGAGVRSRTVASLRWRLEHGREALTPRHVLILDEAGMTSDADVAKLLGAVAASGAKLVAVGDYRQLDAVGPGGALEALSTRHPSHVWTLRDNLRQADRAERHALDQLRAGSVPVAVKWYQDHGRAHPAPFQEVAVARMAKAWAAEVAAGREVLLLAYRRGSVEALNQAARTAWDGMAQLTGPELEAPVGRRYRGGDRVIALSPGPGGAWTTSQRAVVASVDPVSQSLVALTPDGAHLHMRADDIGADKLDYAYAITAHRSQGATEDVTHVLEDGGGRELAYVAMSRARYESHVHVVAQDEAWAHDHLVWAWGQDRRQGWALDREERKTLAELSLGAWARYKARRQLQEATGAFDRALGTWEVAGKPYARRIEADRQDMAVKVDRLEQAQQARAIFFEHNPDITQRVTELERQQHWKLSTPPENCPSWPGSSHAPSLGVITSSTTSVRASTCSNGPVASHSTKARRGPGCYRKRAGAPSSPWRESCTRVPAGACPPLKPLSLARSQDGGGQGRAIVARAA